MGSRFRFHVYPSGGAPIYQQLMTQVKFQVVSGNLRPGDLLPSVRDTAEELQINPMTVSKAYSILEREGVLVRDRGYGMRVLPGAVKGGIRERREELKGLLKDVIVKAHQLGLDADEVLNLLRPMLGELSRKDLREVK